MKESNHHNSSAKQPPLRSKHWYGGSSKDGFIHRSWMKNQGFPSHAFDGRPVIGICNTWSELTPCNSNLRTIADAVKRGVWEAGGFPVEFPVMSLGETQMRPTAMLFRNLMSMDVEESIRAYGMDGVVLLGGCDKTTPAQLMGAASVDIPTVVVSSGPMLNGKWRGKDIGSGTDVWKFSESVRAGSLSNIEFMAAESGMSRSPGVCMTMGTASTMASLVETMGLSLPNNATLPAVDARRMALAHVTGNRIVGMVKENLTLSAVLTRASFINAIVTNAAIGGSTNAVLHLLAIAGRLGIPLTLADFDKHGKNIPCILNCMPSGKYLMEDFCYAGGIPTILASIEQFLDTSAISIKGTSIQEYWQHAENFNSDVILPLDKPLINNAGIRILKGNIAPQGAVIKPSATSVSLLKHEGPAYVFESIEEMKETIDNPELAVTKDSILVLKGCGPKGYPGMAEVGNIPIPKKLVEQGITDMLRISDARMSGTAFGAVVLHVCPEAYAGGPLAIVQTGDSIRLDTQAGELNLLISKEQLKLRLAQWKPPPNLYTRGYYKLYIDHVMQADTGADLDFLVGSSGSEVTRESH